MGEDAFNSYLQKKALGNRMKSVGQVMLKSLMAGVEDLPIKISKPMVKAVTIMALQPLASGARLEEIKYDLMVRLHHCRSLSRAPVAHAVLCSGRHGCGHHHRRALPQDGDPQDRAVEGPVLGKEADWSRMNSPSLMIGIRPTWS